MVMHRVLPWFPRYLLGPECSRFSGRCFEQQLFKQPSHRDLGLEYLQVAENFFAFAFAVGAGIRFYLDFVLLCLYFYMVAYGLVIARHFSGERGG